MEVINTLFSNDIGYLNALRQAPSMPPPVTLAPAILAPAIAPVVPKLAVVQKSTLSPLVWVVGGIAILVVAATLYQDSKKEKQ